MKQNDDIVMELGFTVVLVTLAVISSICKAQDGVIFGCFLISLLPFARRFLLALK